MESMDLGLLNAAMSGKVDQLRQIDQTLLSGTTPQQNTALHVSVMYGQEEFVKAICEKDASMLLKVNSRKETPLHLAAALGYDSIVTFFIQFSKSSTASQHAEDVEEAGGHARLHQLLGATNEKGDTALHEAVRNGRATAAMALLRGDPETLKLVNNDGESVLYLAAVRPLLRVVFELADKEKPYVDYCNCAGPGGRTALHAAVLANHTETAEKLLKVWPELAKERDETESTPLHYAVETSKPAVAQKLLGADHSMAYVLNKDGDSPLHVTAKMGNVETFQVIVQRCPDAVGIPDRHGRNVLHVAVNARELGLVRYILRDGRLAAYLMNQRDNDGSTPLHAAAEQGDGSFIVELLQNKTLNRNAVNKAGKTAGDIFYGAVMSSLTMKSVISSAILLAAIPGRVPRDSQEVSDIRKETRRLWKEHVEKLLIVATLVATVTFAAPFAMPGGYNSNDSSDAGMAVLAKKAALQVFLFCDTVAMLCSVLAVVFGIRTVRRGTFTGLDRGYALLDTSFTFMSLAFGTGMYAVTAPGCLWLAILVCLICCSIPIFNGVRFIRWGCHVVALIYGLLDLEDA